MCKLPILVGPQIFIFIAFYYTYCFSCFYNCLKSRERGILVERYLTIHTYKLIRGTYFPSNFWLFWGLVLCGLFVFLTIMQETHIFRLNEQENGVGALNLFHLDGNMKRHWLTVDMGQNFGSCKEGVLVF